MNAHRLTPRMPGQHDRWQIKVEKRLCFNFYRAIVRPLFFAAVLAMNAEPCWADSWTTAPTMLTARRALAATSSTDGAKIYALGGSNSAGALNTVEVYDAPSRTWSTAAAMPTAREYLAAATGQDGTIYALGGRDRTNTPIATVEAYNPSTGIWSTVAPMLTARSALAAATGPDGKIYALGGRSVDDLPLNNVEVYDPSSNSWTALRPMPTARRYLAAVTGPDGQVYALGGSNGTDVFDRVEVYRPSTDSWTAIAPMGTARTHLAAAIGPNGWIYALGGYNRAIDFLDTAEAYNPSTGTWGPVDPMPTARHSLAAATGLLGTIHAIGGTNAGGQLNRLEVYGPSSTRWSGADPLHVGREALAATTGLDGKIYTLGGLRDGRAQSVVEVFDPSARDWNPIAPMLTARWGPAAATGLDGRIYAIGGFSSGGYLFSVGPELQLFNLGLEYVDELDRSEVSDALAEEFRRHGRPLGSVFGVDVELTGSQWTIHDVDSQTDYRIRNDGQTLRVYLDFVRELDELFVSPDLREQFRTHGWPLANYEVDVQLPGHQWTIHDLDGDTILHVDNEGGTLDVSGEDAILKTAEVYDPSTGGWSSISPMPSRACFLAAATGPDGQIYAFGGCDRLSDCDRGSFDTFAYNPVTGIWATLAPMDKGRAFLAGAAGSDGRIYAIGGIGLDPHIPEIVIHDSVEAYNPLNDSWSAVARMPTPRMGLAAAVASDGTIYAIGGDNRTSTFLDTVETFSPSTGAWSSIAPMPTRRRDLTAAASRVLGVDRIFAVGGHGVEFPLATVEVYTP